MEILFLLLRDNALPGSRAFRSQMNEKYNMSNDDAVVLYTRIHNYQIKKYGARITTGCSTKTYDNEIINKRASARKTSNRRNRGLREWRKEDEKK